MFKQTIKSKTVKDTDNETNFKQHNIIYIIICYQYLYMNDNKDC